jgi:hypothetical protein
MRKGNIANTKGRGKKFSKDYQPPAENTGRPKNVFKQFHGLYECSRADIECVLTELISKTPEELSTIKNDKTTIAMRAIIAAVLLEDKRNGRTFGIDFLINRLFGSVVQKVESNVSINTDDEKVASVLAKYGVSKSKD